MGRSKKLKIGDDVYYTLVGDIPREWTIEGTFGTTEGTMAALSRPDEEKKLKVDRCNADINNLTKVD